MPLIPKLNTDDFDGEGGIDRSRGKRTLQEVLTALGAAAPFIGSFTDSTRPLLLPSWVALGYESLPAAGSVYIWNTSDTAPNIWDGDSWRTFAGVDT